ncbi:MAG: 50S ribosomal protein L11 [Rickettsiales bacterium]|jgi:large subunit ribosomal protein L11|nr:50S ribosomal protein L11 [Rickettsiales bacterium]
MAKDGKKEVIGLIKLQVPSTKANPAPPIGPALGQKGVNIMDFCKQFNELKFDYPAGTPIPTIITVYKDKSFIFETKQPPVTFLIEAETGIKKGSSAVGKETIGKITKKQIENIAKKKMVDMNADTLEQAMSMIAGSALSMGFEVVE